MPFYRTQMGMVHMRGSRLPQPCLEQVGIEGQRGLCGAFPGFLCDWPAGGGRTCDRDLCEVHAHQVGKNRHYCPEHHRDHLDQQPQKGLFTGLMTT